MIAPIDSLVKASRIGNLDVARTASDDDLFPSPKAPDKTWQTAKQWVEKHPTSAVVASVVLGLLVGYVSKRRSR